MERRHHPPIGARMPTFSRPGTSSQPVGGLSGKTRIHDPLVAQTSVRRLAQPCRAELGEGRRLLQMTAWQGRCGRGHQPPRAAKPPGSGNAVLPRVTRDASNRQPNLAATLARTRFAGFIRDAAASIDSGARTSLLALLGARPRFLESPAQSRPARADLRPPWPRMRAPCHTRGRAAPSKRRCGPLAVSPSEQSAEGRRQPPPAASRLARRGCGEQRIGHAPPRRETELRCLSRHMRPRLEQALGHSHARRARRSGSSGSKSTVDTPAVWIQRLTLCV